jgi:hypothetical protein
MSYCKKIKMGRNCPVCSGYEIEIESDGPNPISSSCTRCGFRVDTINEFDSGRNGDISANNWQEGVEKAQTILRWVEKCQKVIEKD